MNTSLNQNGVLTCLASYSTACRWFCVPGEFQAASSWAENNQIFKVSREGQMWFSCCGTACQSHWDYYISSKTWETTPDLRCQWGTILPLRPLMKDRPSFQTPINPPVNPSFMMPVPRDHPTCKTWMRDLSHFKMPRRDHPSFKISYERPPIF